MYDAEPNRDSFKGLNTSAVQEAISILSQSIPDHAIFDEHSGRMEAETSIRLFLPRDFADPRSPIEETPCKMTLNAWGNIYDDCCLNILLRISREKDNTEVGFHEVRFLHEDYPEGRVLYTNADDYPHLKFHSFAQDIGLGTGCISSVSQYRMPIFQQFKDLLEITTIIINTKDSSKDRMLGWTERRLREAGREVTDGYSQEIIHL